MGKLSDDRMRVVEVAILLVTFAFLVVTALIGVFRDDYARVSGQPLDAHTVIEYDRPAWLPDCERCYRVTDRITHKAWWLLEFEDGSHVVMEDE